MCRQDRYSEPGIELPHYAGAHDRVPEGKRRERVLDERPITIPPFLPVLNRWAAERTETPKCVEEGIPAFQD